MITQAIEITLTINDGKRKLAVSKDSSLLDARIAVYTRACVVVVDELMDETYTRKSGFYHIGQINIEL